MEAVYQGASTALVLTGIAVALAAASVLWWVVGRIRIQQEELALERASCERSTARFNAQLEAERRRAEVLRTLVPVAAGVAGHLLGSLAARGESAACPLPPPIVGCTHWPCPPPSPEPDDDDLTQVELDLQSMFEAAREVGVGDWLLDMFRRARDRHSNPAPDVEPEGSPEA